MVLPMIIPNPKRRQLGVPSAHINFIYYVTYVIQYLIVLQGCMHTGTYTNTKITCVRIMIPTITLRVFGVVFGLYWAEINKKNRNFNLMFS